MLTRFKTFFDDRLSPESADDSEQAIRLAACALLFEMVKADFEISAAELQTMRQAVKHVMRIDDGTADALIEMAEQEAREATSLYQFTQLINSHYSAQQKADLIRAQWMIAYADGRVDKYEEHYLRKLADLLYVPHSTFIRTKLEVQQSRQR